MAKNKVKKFYDNKGGEKLIDTKFFVPEIDDYLRNEKEFIQKILELGKYPGILEIGCMNGRNLDIAKEQGIRYVGIDIVRRFVDEANRKIENLGIDAIALECDVKYLYDIKDVISSDFLAVFPFNSFGNVDDPQRALNSLSKQGLDLSLIHI